MSVAMFIIGFIIFSAYCYFLIWNIYYSSKKQKEENYPNLIDDIDMDGMGNFSRFPTDVTIEKRKMKKSKYETARSTKKK